VAIDSAQLAIDRVSALAASAPGLRMLILFGSRARGDAQRRSDWDLAYTADPGFDADGFMNALAGLLAADRIDMIDVDRAGGQLRYRVARDGRVLHVDDESRFERFWLDAVSFWCDAEPIVGRGYDALLAELGR
jgi:predicted nucleotidyltransferase